MSGAGFDTLPAELVSIIIRLANIRIASLVAICSKYFQKLIDNNDVLWRELAVVEFGQKLIDTETKRRQAGYADKSLPWKKVCFRLMRLYRLPTSVTSVDLRKHRAAVMSFDYVPEKDLLISSSNDTTIKYWTKSTLLNEDAKLSIAQEHHVFCVHADYTKDLLVSASADCTVRTYELSTGKPLQVMTGHTSWVLFVQILPLRNQLVSAAYDTTLRVWSLETGECLNILTGHTNRIMALAVSPTLSDTGVEKYIASGSNDGTIRIWDLDSSNTVHIFNTTHKFVSCLAFADSKTLVSGGYDGCVMVWDLENKELLHTWTACSGTVGAVAALGKVVIAGGEGLVTMWDIEKNQCIRKLFSKHRTVWSVLAMPDAFVYGSADGTLTHCSIENEL